MTAEAPSTKHLLSRKKKIVFTVVTVIIVFLFCALLIDLIIYGKGRAIWHALF